MRGAVSKADKRMQARLRLVRIGLQGPVGRRGYARVALYCVILAAVSAVLLVAANAQGGSHEQQTAAHPPQTRAGLGPCGDGGTRRDTRDTRAPRAPRVRELHDLGRGVCSDGERGGATCHGTVRALTFRGACIEKFAGDDLFDPKRMTHWGCHLFDDEGEARRRFG